MTKYICPVCKNHELELLPNKMYYWCDKETRMFVRKIIEDNKKNEKPPTK